MEIVAHRGFAGRQPEMTRAAYLDAIAWAEQTGTPLGLECDVHFSRDDQLICLHDLRVDRTSTSRGPAYARTVRQLRRLDFGSRRLPQPSPDQRAMVTLVELLDLITQARARGVEVSAVIETKHPNPRGLEVEARVTELLTARGWQQPDSPVRVISFSVEAITELARLLPEVPRSFLIEKQFGEWIGGDLPTAVRTVGVELALLRAHPDFVARAARHGNQVHAWTVNQPDDVVFCVELGVTALTTDHPDVVLASLAGP